MLSLSDGKELIKLARNAISSEFSGEDLSVADDIKKKFSEKQGVFVTITIGEQLRGCIGFTEPLFPLYDTIINAAKGAAFSDPRFAALTEDEYENIAVEVSVLTAPEIISGEKEEYTENIKIGRDGLIIEKGRYKGLLLPQVFPEWHADAKKALEMTCEKAGLDIDAWKEPDCDVYRFSAQIFKEKDGKVVEEKE